MNYVQEIKYFTSCCNDERATPKGFIFCASEIGFVESEVKILSSEFLSDKKLLPMELPYLDDSGKEIIVKTKSGETVYNVWKKAKGKDYLVGCCIKLETGYLGVECSPI